jgi:hypothetical protein
MQRTLLTDAWFRSLTAAAVVVVAAVGCEEKIYEVDLKPRGDKIERRLTLTRYDKRDHSKERLTPDDKTELAGIARAYQTETPSLPRAEAVFSGTFGGVLPHDVGGDGHYVHWESPLGRVSIYVERFRGNDDIYSSLEARRKAVDALVDLLVGWFESELSTEPDWPALRAFLNDQFRTDLQNFSLFVWSTNVGGVFASNDALAEVAVRAAQYCVERGYASYEEAPVLMREFEDATRRDHSIALLARIRRLIVRRAKSSSEARWKRLPGFLADLNSVSASWERYFVRSPYFKRRVAELVKEIKQRHEVPTGNAPLSRWRQDAVQAELNQLFLGAFPLNYHFLSDASRVRARLQAPRKPFWTNGSWNAQESRVEWSPLVAELPKPDREQFWDWPTLCFAAWDEPNEEGQKPIFGSVGLTGQELLTYCLWYQGLSGLEKKEWDAFLATVKRGQPASRLNGFRFTNEPPAKPSYLSVANGGVTIIGGVLHPQTRPTIQPQVDEQLKSKATKP